MDNKQIVNASLLKANALDIDFLQKQCDKLSERKIDFGDIYLEKTISEGFVLEDSIVKDGSFSISKGLGVRAVIGEKTGFAYSDVIDRKSLEESVLAARSISSGQTCNKVRVLNEQHRESLYVHENPIELFPREKKVKILETIDRKARALDSRIMQVMASINATYINNLVMCTDGTFAYDVKPIVRVIVNVVMQGKNQRIETGFASRGGAYLFDRLDNEEIIDALVKEAVHAASINLEAIEAPAGTMSVVLGAGWPGVLIHEAVGHGLEGDFNRQRTSAFTDKIGHKVASECCTIIDDGTIKERRGSLNFDDEGTKTQKNVLIENGILRSYMQDKQNAMLMGQKSTGNGRRESYNSLVLPRMTNTYLDNGNYTHDEIIASVKKGIYAVNFKGGQVDITSGSFVFSASEAYLIENGKVTAPIKGATLIGNGLEVMHKISKVGNNLAFDQGVGVCGKQGQSVAVGIGQPTVLVDELTVGGSQVDS